MVREIIMGEPIKRGRGRPRTEEVIERDERIFHAIAGSDRAVTKYEIAAGTGVPDKKVYMSLRRLSLVGRISRVYVVNKQHFWSDRPFTKTPMPAPDPIVPSLVDEQPALIPAAVFSSPE